MNLLNGLAFAAAAIALVLPAAASADTPAAADAAGKKEPAGCLTTAVVKPESEGDGVAKPANSVTASPAPAAQEARQLGGVEGSGDAKPADGHQAPQDSCAAG